MKKRDYSLRIVEMDFEYKIESVRIRITCGTKRRTGNKQDIRLEPVAIGKVLT